MLQQPWEGVYNCSAEESIEGEYSKCTVVIRKRQISDDIIEKQSFLIQKMKQDNVFIKRLLETKSSEVSKMKVTIQLLQSQKVQLYQQLEKIRKHQQDFSILQAENQRLRYQNQELRIELQSERVYIEQPFKLKVQELIQQMQGLKAENEFLVQMSKNQDSDSQERFTLLQKRCRQLKQELEKQRQLNEKIKRNLQKKLTSSQPIKIIQGSHEADSQENFDEVKLIDIGFHRKIGSDQLDNSLGQSRKQSDILFHDSQNSYEESDRPINRSVAYQKSEAEIQTEKWDQYESGLISREKIEKSLNQKRNNHHMKPLDEHARIMNLSKELNQKDKTIKELQKKVQKEKKNSQSVKKKLKQKEKQLKHLKKERSLSREAVGQDGTKIKKEQSMERVQKSQQAHEKVQAKEEYQKGIKTEQNQAKLDLEVNQQNKFVASEPLKQHAQFIAFSQRENEGKQKIDIRIKNQMNEQMEYQEQNQNIIQIREETDHKEVIVQTESLKNEEQKNNTQVSNEKLLNLIQNLKRQIEELQSQKTKERQNYQLVTQNYKQVQLNIRISQKHDEDSDVEAENELTKLRQQNKALKEQLKQYFDNEPIPFHEVQAETHFREVVTQTQTVTQAAVTASEVQATNYWDQVIQNIQNNERKSKAEEQNAENSQPKDHNKEQADWQPQPDSGNSFFSNLMSGLLGNDNETVNVEQNERRVAKGEQVQKPHSQGAQQAVQQYNEAQFKAIVGQKQDEIRYTEPSDELAKLREQNKNLKQKPKYYTDNEPIPPIEAQQETHFREVVTQIHVATQNEIHGTNYGDQALQKNQQKNKEYINKLVQQPSSNNNLFSNLMPGLLGNNSPAGIEIQEKKAEEHQNQWKIQNAKLIQLNANSSQKKEDVQLNCREIKELSFPTFTISQNNKKVLHQEGNNEQYLLNLQPVEKDNEQAEDRRDLMLNNPINKAEIQSIQTPKFEEPLKSVNLFASIQKQNFLRIEDTSEKVRQKLAEELALKEEELATLAAKMQWLEQKLLKYKKIIWKNKKQLKEAVSLNDADEMFQIDIEQEEVLLSQVQTQTNPYMFSEEGIQKYSEELQFKLEQEEKISKGLRAKLKRWQNVIRKMHYQGDQFNQDMQDLQIQEENIQLCEVQIQVNLMNSEKIEKAQQEVGRVKMKQLLLSGIQNLQKKWMGDDSEEGQSQNYSDRGRNTKRSIGSDQEQRAKVSHQKMLETELNHIYKDTQSIFKKYQFKVQEDINIDNFKDIMDNFASYVKRQTFHQGMKYNSFEDIKEQENDDSLVEKQRKSTKKGGSQNLLSQPHEQITHRIPEKAQKQKQNILPMQILYIEKENIQAHSYPAVELNPLFISEVSYKPINKTSYNDLVLRMTELKEGELSKIIESFVEELQLLKQNLSGSGELELSSCQQVIKVCGFDNLAKFLGH